MLLSALYRNVSTTNTKAILRTLGGLPPIPAMQFARCLGLWDSKLYDYDREYSATTLHNHTLTNGNLCSHALGLQTRRIITITTMPTYARNATQCDAIQCDVTWCIVM